MSFPQLFVGGSSIVMFFVFACVYYCPTLCPNIEGLELEGAISDFSVFEKFEVKVLMLFCKSEKFHGIF